MEARFQGEGVVLGQYVDTTRKAIECATTLPLRVFAEFLLSVIELLFLSLTVEALQGKRVKTRSLQEWVGHFEPKFQGEGVVPGEYFLVSTKLDTFCYPTVKTAPCYVPSF